VNPADAQHTSDEDAGTHRGPRARLDVLGAEVVEETAALAEEHRDQVNLQLVEDAGGEGELREAEGPPTGDHRASRRELVEDLTTEVRSRVELPADFVRYPPAGPAVQ
jgi:hypothetical protein